MNTLKIVLLAGLIISLFGCVQPSAPQTEGPQVEPTAQAKSFKRGIAYDLKSDADMSALEPGVSWWYNWSPAPSSNLAADYYAQYATDFVPMIWNGDFNAAEVEAQIRANPQAKYILVMNEPSHVNAVGGSNITPAQAAEIWPRYEEVARNTGTKIVGPQVTWGTMGSFEDPIAWLDAFYAAYRSANGRDPQIDYLGFHWYDYGLAEQLDRLGKYGKPFWVTEFANWHKGDGDAEIDSAAKQKTQMAEMVALLESRDDVFRYAWFTGRWDNDAHFTSLLGADGQLTELGEYYLSLPFEEGATTDEPPALSGTKSLQVTTPGFTDQFLRHRDALAFTENVTGNASDILKQAASWQIVPGLADAECYSFESVTYPGEYVRHAESRVRTDESDGSYTFEADATWCAVAGLSGTGISFETKNFPGRYLRHHESAVWLAEKGGPLASDSPTSFEQDASWNIVGAWTNQEDSDDYCDNPPSSVTGGGPKEINLKNTTADTMRVAIFRNLALGENPSFNGPDASFMLAPGCTQEVSVPRDWQGRAQKFSGSVQDPSNWAEINFEPGNRGLIGPDKIWFNESDIPGRNSSILMTTGDGVVGGTAKSVLYQAPANIVVTDSSGQQVIASPQWFDGHTNWDAVNFLRATIGIENAYVLPDDHDAVRLSYSDTMTVEFGNP